MEKSKEKDPLYLDKFLVAVLACFILAVALIISIWWYYDHEISRMKQDIYKSPSSINAVE